MEAQSKYKTWIKQGSSQETGSGDAPIWTRWPLRENISLSWPPNSSKNVNLEQFSKNLCLFLVEMSLKDYDLWKKHSLFSLKTKKTKTKPLW